ncbi:MAG: hypothetical protein J7598_10695 [Mitsuaria chitosanitabida]|uniref:hypothetical protein n=1 Tax=Roseateles chitosanitabidus TaxID=65048 RepID=UPI001B07B880|nr:hypothetical protein [Roseateles chitosanitabidus]MBO9687073.1 hypothetical protein [Roseateles chitosanitabidus]
MLVQALRLRRQGARLSASELRAEIPLAGLLRMRDSSYQGRDGRGKQVCLLMPQTGGVAPLVELFSARVLRIEDRGILVGGHEEFWNRKQRTSYMQVLWAWPMPPESKDEPPPASASSPGVRRLLEALDSMV